MSVYACDTLYVLVTEKMSDHSCYLRDSSIYVHGTVATPPPDLCGTWKVPAWSPDNVSDGRETNMVSGLTVLV